MKFAIANILVMVLLFAGTLVAQECGRRLGERHRALDPKHDKPAYGATEGAVFALLGLFLAFAFSGAGSRFDARRQLVVQEANAIGTAWLRIAILPAQRQPELRALFREYVDARLATYRALSEGASYEPALARSLLLQQQIWDASTRAAAESGSVASFTLVLPALNDMIDITTTRTASTALHPPAVVYIMIVILVLVSALFVGYGMAGREVRSIIHTLGFATITSIVLSVILDLEFPRLGFVRVDSADQVLVDLRASMK